MSSADLARGELLTIPDDGRSVAQGLAVIFPRLQSKPEGELKIELYLTLPCRLYDNLCTVSRESGNECPGEIRIVVWLKESCSTIASAT